MAKQRKFYPCELCLRKVIASKETTVCLPCDRELIAADKAYFANVESTRTKRKCRSCDCTLPATRYFQCDDCLRDLPSECEWEQLAEHGNDEGNASITWERLKREGVTHKACKTCKETRAIGEFSFNAAKKDKLELNCKICWAVSRAKHSTRNRVEVSQ